MLIEKKSEYSTFVIGPLRDCNVSVDQHHYSRAQD